MSTYTQILYHIVFATKDHQRTIDESNQEILYRYIWRILENHECHPYQINGTEDHLHLITHLHPQIGLAQMVKNIKLATSTTIKQNNLLPNFRGWQEGYGAFTYAYTAKRTLIDYVRNQKIHHKKIDLLTEYRQLLMEHGIQFNEKYLI